MWELSTHYLWWILALLLIAGEVLMPGYFLLWIGLAAAAMGVVLWLVPGLAWLTQAVLFAVLAFAACVLYARLLRPKLSGELRATWTSLLLMEANRRFGATMSR